MPLYRGRRMTPGEDARDEKSSTENFSFLVLDFVFRRNPPKIINMTLKRATLAEQAYEELRDRIVSGALPPGRRMLVEELAVEMSISQTPVKEAIALLERDGLIEGTARRSSVVRRFHGGDVRHIYAARTLLEIHALREGCATGAITPAFIARIEEIFDRQRAHAERHQPVVFVEAVRLDREFHDALVALADNPVVQGWHRGILAQTQTILTYAIDDYDVRRAHSEHAAIIAALRLGDAEAIAEAMQRHLTAARDEILARTPGLDGRSAA
jgi:DNA-binding GntR family transcriptional regulator